MQFLKMLHINDQIIYIANRNRNQENQEHRPILEKNT